MVEQNTQATPEEPAVGHDDAARQGPGRSENASATEDDISVVLDGIDVIYRVYEDARPRVFDLMRGKWHRKHRRIHAVKDVSLVASRGETIGIVGANGSGKSTLLLALSGLLPVDSGQVYVRSQPTLLGVGSALQLDLSGRHNVVLGCLALGMPMAEVRSRLDEIVHFAGVEDFADLPMRAFSSGMRARLVFSIATATAPDILVVDEALAVGDEEFRERSQERIDDLRNRAATVFLVTHNLNQVVDTCTRAIWIHDGRLRCDAEPQDTVDAYLQWIKEQRSKRETA